VLNKKTINSFENLYKKGYDKSYPHIELVRLEKLFLNKNKKKTLDYGSGHGANGIHLLKRGYEVTFCDISKYALKIVKKKISKKYKKKTKYLHLQNVKCLEKKIYQNYFDNIICLSVINNLSSLKQFKKIFLMFNKMLKSKGKLIVDTNLVENNYKVLKKINSTTILTSLDEKNNFKFKMCFPKNINQFSKILEGSGFQIKDIGHSSFKVFNQFEKVILFCAVKK